MESQLINLVTLAPKGTELSIIGLLAEASIVVQLVLLILIGMSIFSWWVIFLKHRQLSVAEEQSQQFLKRFWDAEQIADVYEQRKDFRVSPLNESFSRAYRELLKLQKRGKADKSYGIENIERAFRREQLEQLHQLAHRVPALATIASAAPFVGLFGTVWGIMDAFLNIANAGQASLATVAPPIAEALIATAIGLVAAIPSVIFFNRFQNQIHHLETQLDTFGSDFINIIRRYLD
ncbi:MAG: protein TolQ [Myxococcota bacterium]|nr:protein TolQ [Myxococcota bacterium]